MKTGFLIKRPGRWSALTLVLAANGIGQAALAAPIAYYTDLTSSPAGAYVTVWGKGFGSSAGSVMVGGATASGADIVSWSDS
ncbi:MAG TPA: hypothetical protein VNN09_06890, partial [Candidatus Competibacteraceae bacterium]|nr:hypothetical protein [Candidatus Competibacteraceae bacterium]